MQLLLAIALAFSVVPQAEPPRPVTLVAVGDLMLARSIGERIVKRRDPFAAVGEQLRAADLTIGNLECAIATVGVPQPKAYTFRAPPAAAARMAEAGFDVLALANNHSLDYGTAALSETVGLLGAQQIEGVGAGPSEAAAHRPAVREVRGVKIAFLAYVDVPTERGGFRTARWAAHDGRGGVAWAETTRIRADVAAARDGADAVVVLLHSGIEGQETPSTAQRAAARAAIDAGAALVIGSHPHVLQGVERYRDGVIAYSLGNFVFDGLYKTSETAILTVTLEAGKVTSVAWTPVALRDGFPQVAGGKQAKRILDRLARLSR